jgi:hypothetical protein
MNTFAVVVTSVASPNLALKTIAEGCQKNNNLFFVIGDNKSPVNFNLAGCNFFPIDTQKKLRLKFAQQCPENHYSRKNIGYLLAIQSNSEIIVETDDDNIPLCEFWAARERYQTAEYVETGDWINVYMYYSSDSIWPRGFPLEFVKKSLSSCVKGRTETRDCPIQQGLVDKNPDVDAIYRMTMNSNMHFSRRNPISLGNNTWCPFNSQNTTWFKDAFPLLYLPSYCNFRMTDIWRSFIAQRIAWTCGWNILFHQPNAYQERNEHNLMNDFYDEIPGYLYNSAIRNSLIDLDLKQGKGHIFENLHRSYKKMINGGWITDEKELILLDLWIEDLIALGMG